MSTGRRAYDILRGYVNNGWEYLQGGREETDAERELREAMDAPVRAHDNAPSETRPAKPPEPPMTLEQARRLLAVDATANSSQIQAAYDEIKTVANPSKFAVGTAAYERATALHLRLEAAKRILVENIDPTIKRFEGLEIE